MNGIAITITMSLKEAEDISRILIKGDPFGIFAGGVLKRIDTEARKVIEQSKEVSTVK